jgi:cytochrome c peroxidase
MRKRFGFELAALLAGLQAATVAAQAPPGPPPPLGNPPVPAANPQSPAKIALGQALFWDEQLSLTGTVACGTCHRPFAGGGDPRSALAGADTTHRGPDGLSGTADDIVGSQGVPAHAASGEYAFDPTYGYAAQVGGRSAVSAVNAAYSPLLFWDGRAGGTFVDPRSGAVLIAQGGALENQALGPVVNAVEMSPANAQVGEVPARILRAVPLVLSHDVPAALAGWIDGRDYPALFEEVFGTREVSAARIALAIASYERSLVANQTPFDAENGGTPSLTDLERQGRQVFAQAECVACHGGALTTDNQFHYIGVRPVNEDLGRFAQTLDPADRGRFRTPGLRNVELRGSMMHNGRFATLEEVVDFYDRGGDFTAPNKDPRVRQRNLTAQQKTALLAFLRRPLTDPRVAAESGPFERPALYTEGTRAPKIVGIGRAGSAARVPQLGALEPPLLGSRFTVSLRDARGGADAVLVVSRADPGVADSLPVGDFANLPLVLPAEGRASVELELGLDVDLVGTTLYGRWYVEDDQAAGGYAVSPAFEATVFGTSWDVFRDDFE